MESWLEAGKGTMVMSSWQKPIMGATLNQTCKGAMITSLWKESAEKLQPQSYVAEDTWEAIVLAVERSQRKCMNHMMEHQHQEKATSNPSNCLTCQGAKSHFAANLGRLPQKAKDLFSYVGGCIILQQIQKAFCRKLRTHSHIPGAILFHRKYEKPSSKS